MFAFSLSSASHSSSLVSTITSQESCANYSPNDKGKTVDRAHSMVLFPELSSGTSSGDETPSSGNDTSDYSDGESPSYILTSTGPHNSRRSIISLGRDNASFETTSDEDSRKIMIPRPILEIRDPSVSHKLAKVGPRYSGLIFGSQYVKGKSNNYTKVFQFLIKNKASLESSDNVLVLVRTSIACAYGGRKQYVKLPQGYTLKFLKSRFQGATSSQNELNVSLFCLLGHILLRHASQFEAFESESIIQRVPGCCYQRPQTVANVGGAHIWECDRSRGKISGIKWHILKQYSKIKLDEAACDAICAILGIKTDYGNEEQEILSSLLEALSV